MANGEGYGWRLDELGRRTLALEKQMDEIVDRLRLLDRIDERQNGLRTAVDATQASVRRVHARLNAKDSTEAEEAKAERARKGRERVSVILGILGLLGALGGALIAALSAGGHP